MSEEIKHWDSKVEFLYAPNLILLEDKINKFCEGKFVVGIQYPETLKGLDYMAVVSYKVKQQ